MSDFYLVLPSNASMHLHPNNTLTNFVTTLLRHVNLNGDWKCGLAEINYPHNWFNVKKEDGVLEIQPAPGIVSEHGARGNASLQYIDAGYYEQPELLIKAIGKKLMTPRTGSKKKGARLTYSSVTQKATVYLTPNTRLTLTGVMGQILGIPSKVLTSPVGNYSLKPFEGYSVVDMNQSTESLYGWTASRLPMTIRQMLVLKTDEITRHEVRWLK